MRRSEFFGRRDTTKRERERDVSFRAVLSPFFFLFFSFFFVSRLLFFFFSLDDSWGKKLKTRATALESVKELSRIFEKKKRERRKKSTDERTPPLRLGRARFRKEREREREEKREKRRRKTRRAGAVISRVLPRSFPWFRSFFF